MDIGIIGTGRVGTALARRWAAQGHSILFGARDPHGDKAKAALAAISRARVAGVRDAAAFGDAILLAIPGSAVLETIAACGDPSAGSGQALRGKIIIDANNWFGLRPDGVTSSLAEAIAQAAPGARVVKAFNTTGSGNMLDPDYGMTSVDMFICGDDADAKAAVAGLAAGIGFDVVDAGPLSAALHLEHLAQLWVHMAYQQGQGPNIAWKLLRRP